MIPNCFFIMKRKIIDLIVGFSAEKANITPEYRTLIDNVVKMSIYFGTMIGLLISICVLFLVYIF